MKGRIAVRRLALPAAILAVLPIAACGSSDSSGKSATGANAGKKEVNIAAVVADQPDPFYITMRCGARDAAKALGVNLNWQGTNSVDAGPELSVLNAVTQRDPDGIILAPFSPTAFLQPVKQLMEKGTPVVTVDGQLAKPVELQNIRTDNFAAGEVAGKALGDMLGGKGTVGVIGFNPGLPVTDARRDGFISAIKKGFPDITLLPTQYGGADAGKAARITAAFIEAHAELNAMFATDMNDALGMSSAVVAAGKSGKIKLVAFDAAPKEVDGLRKGLFDGLVAQSPYKEGYSSVEVLAKYLRGEITKDAIKQEYATPQMFVTRDNVDAPDTKPYLYRPSC